MVDFQTARRTMVDSQVRTSDVTNLELIGAMSDVPREVFVPDALAPVAYLDRDLPYDLSGGKPPRFLIKPMVLARLIQAADPRPQDRVLVIGAGTGYAAAVLGRLAAAVTALEEDGAIAAFARSALAKQGAANVTVVTGPLTQGWQPAQPYDVILMDGGVETIPDAVFGQLADGGRLVAVLGEGRVGEAMLYQSDRGQSDHGEVSGRALFDAAVPLLPGFKKAPAFVF
jgi:protein-L-isoaspartate(D-aspartate) O-methyltransferase